MPRPLAVSASDVVKALVLVLVLALLALGLRAWDLDQPTPEERYSHQR